MILNFENFLNENKDQRDINRAFRKEVYKLISNEDRDKLIQARTELDRLKDKWYSGNDKIIDQRKNLIKYIKQVEKKYYDKYQDLKNVIVSDKLKNARIKLGTFDD